MKNEKNELDKSIEKMKNKDRKQKIKAVEKTTKK